MQKNLIWMEKNFFYCLIFLCSVYFCIEYIFNTYTMLGVDDFWFAHRAYEYKNKLPYRDFAPYKTVLGYYLLLLPLLSQKGIISTLIYTKNFIAGLNTLLLIMTSCWLTRFFSRISILTSLLLLIPTDLVLTYSTNIRVDLFAYWLCFLSFLMLLERRYFFAGILIGLGFIISQKTIWYLFASNSALGIFWLLTSRKLKNLSSMLWFNVAATMILIIYVTFWAHFSSFSIVLKSIFTEASVMYQLDWYGSARQLFWSLTLTYNPFLFLVGFFTAISLLITFKNDHSYFNRVFIILYSFTILFCLLPYKQVFPYYMQVTIPIFFILYSAFFHWLYILLMQNHTVYLIPKKYIVLLIAFYIILLATIIILMKLPTACHLVCILPFAFIFYLFPTQNNNALINNLIFIVIVYMGIIYPLILFSVKAFETTNTYQKLNIQVLNTLLKNDDYVAGIDLIYNKSQPIQGMKHLMGPAIEYLYRPNSKLRSVMLASLDEDPNVTKNSVIQALQDSNVKMIVNNYRVQALPKEIKTFLNNQYEHLWGSIYIYSPRFKAGKNTIYLKFSGNYLIETPAKFIRLNSIDYSSFSTVFLKKGHYNANAQTNFRLKLIPTVMKDLDPTYANDNWKKLVL